MARGESSGSGRYSAYNRKKKNAKNKTSKGADAKQDKSVSARNAITSALI